MQNIDVPISYQICRILMFPYHTKYADIDLPASYQICRYWSSHVVPNKIIYIQSSIQKLKKQVLITSSIQLPNLPQKCVSVKNQSEDHRFTHDRIRNKEAFSKWILGVSWKIVLKRILQTDNWPIIHKIQFCYLDLTLPVFCLTRKSSRFRSPVNEVLKKRLPIISKPSV